MGAAGMGLSNDLRERVVEAVVLGGLSRDQAAAHFKVSIASAVRWVKRFHLGAPPLTQSAPELGSAERDGFEPEIRISVLPSTQSETPVFLRSPATHRSRCLCLCLRKQMIALGL